MSHGHLITHRCIWYGHPRYVLDIPSVWEASFLPLEKPIWCLLWTSAPTISSLPQEIALQNKIRLYKRYYSLRADLAGTDPIRYCSSSLLQYAILCRLSADAFWGAFFLVHFPELTNWWIQNVFAYATWSANPCCGHGQSNHHCHCWCLMHASYCSYWKVMNDRCNASCRLESPLFRMSPKAISWLLNSL